MLDIPLISDLIGTAQVTVNQTVYLCGHQKQIDSGSLSSFLFKINPFKEKNLLEILLSSLYHHYSPLILCIRNDIIAVIGGYRQCHCETYSITQEKWKSIAALPDERYKAGVLLDLGENFIYLFGGYNDAFKKKSSCVLKCEARYFSQWDTIQLKEGSEFIAKCSFGLFNSIDPNTMLIVGGKGSGDNDSNEIIEYDIYKRTASVSNCKWPTEVNFIQSEGFVLDNDKTYIIDSRLDVYVINIKKMDIDRICNIEAQLRIGKAK